MDSGGMLQIIIRSRTVIACFSIFIQIKNKARLQVLFCCEQCIVNRKILFRKAGKYDIDFTGVFS